MRLTSGDCINRLTFLVASRWAGQWEHQQEVRERRTVKQEYWFLQPLQPGALQRALSVGQFPAPLRQTLLSQALNSSNYSLQPEMGNTASLAWSNYTLPRVFSIRCPYLWKEFLFKVSQYECVIAFLLGSCLCTFFIVFTWSMWEADAKTDHMCRKHDGNLTLSKGEWWKQSRPPCAKAGLARPLRVLKPVSRQRSPRSPVNRPVLYSCHA